MSNTREIILRELLGRQRCSIYDLAEAVGISPIAVRHHISRLEAENLIASESERHGVGRPRRMYFLTDEGMERFPTRYLSLSMRLVETLKESFPAEVVNRLFREIASSLAKELMDDSGNSAASLTERLELVRHGLSAQGFTIEITESAGNFEIRETSCPYIHVGQEHPEVCLVDQTLIATVLATDIEKTHCVLNGDAYCAYSAPRIPVNHITHMENAS
ncbi:MAG: winged helix-turn-helix transcriptional regulator [Chloroflexi bacterium]|nr:winged helix-turn-helix transcriptional regulator [Chloroflexota bacterium]